MRVIYEKVYCARGEMENRIKECQLDLFADRTSTATFSANQLRLWFASMAYVLIDSLRRIALPGTDLAQATCATIRRKLFKIGALVTISVRRIKLAMASGSYQTVFDQAHRARAGIIRPEQATASATSARDPPAREQLHSIPCTDPLRKSLRDGFTVVERIKTTPAPRLAGEGEQEWRYEKAG
jgi:hypothetical protein